jgi:hypothetical protein
MTVLHSALHRLGQLQRIPDARAFARAVHDPERAQRDRLAAMVAMNADTAFGRAHRLGEVRTLRDLQARVPVQTYADVEPYVARMMRGERGVLSRERPVFYAASTGTTGAPKRTPTTPSFRKEFQRTVQISMAQVTRRFPRAFRGSVLYFVARKEVARTEDGTPIGYTSGFNFTTLPSVVRRIYAWPYELFEVEDGAARDYLATWIAALSPVTFAATVFPLALTNLLRSAEAFAEPLARDLSRGTLRDDLRLSPAERAFFERYARRDVKAADRVRSEARANGGVLPARAFLPKVELVYCWTSSSAAHYLPELRARLGGDVAIRDAVYAANEGWTNCTFGEDELGGPFCVTGHVFELVETSAWDRGVREGVGPEALEPGRAYRLLLTTSAGLWRYDLGDVVRCTGWYARTPKVHFERRGSASLNLAGEKLDEAHVLRATKAVLDRHGLRATFFAAQPRFGREGRKPRWEIVLELPEVPGDALAEALRADLDAELGRVNEDYADERRMGLDRLVLRLVRPGEHDRDRARRVAEGAPEAQLKVVHLVPEEGALAALATARVVE